MPSYLYNGMCYAEAINVYTAMAADCPPVNNAGLSVSCTPSAAGYAVNIGSGVSFTFVNPTLKNCVPEIADAATLGGLVVAALASAYVFKLLWRAF